MNRRSPYTTSNILIQYTTPHIKAYAYAAASEIFELFMHLRHTPLSATLTPQGAPQVRSTRRCRPRREGSQQRLRGQGSAKLCDSDDTPIHMPAIFP